MSSAHPLPVASWGSWGVSNRAVWLLLDWISWHLIFFQVFTVGCFGCCRICRCYDMVCPICRCLGAPCVPFTANQEVPEVFDVLLDEDCFRRMFFCSGCLADWRRTLEGRNVSRRTTERSEQI
ncbi:uncharacterized protein LOC119336202 isoform X2 [Triticum dicoccoides]|uniref:uncharacterized protein LOC119336202 isoform X2 n=1 Tax=Triticum dicoccoides TaxID=85692 RepID=UPI001891BB6A|nr:uncharacterized protein LOC119336202 isoform X2 [Triticum dicoccoides]